MKYEPAKPNAEQYEREEAIMTWIDYWHTQMPYLGIRKIVKQLKKRVMQWTENWFAD